MLKRTRKVTKLNTAEKAFNTTSEIVRSCFCHHDMLLQTKWLFSITHTVLTIAETVKESKRIITVLLGLCSDDLSQFGIFYQWIAFATINVIKELMF